MEIKHFFFDNIFLFIFSQNKAASVKCHFYLSLNDGINKIYFKIRFYFYRALSRLLLSTFIKSNDDFSELLKFIKKCIYKTFCHLNLSAYGKRSKKKLFTASFSESEILFYFNWMTEMLRLYTIPKGFLGQSLDKALSISKALTDKIDTNCDTL